MKIGLVQTGWDVKHDPQVRLLMDALQLEFVDLIPTKYFNQESSNNSKLNLGDWTYAGLSVRGLQGFFFGLDFQLCSCAQSVDAATRRLDQVLDSIENANNQILILGAPHTRYSRAGHSCGEQEFVEALMQLAAFSSARGFRLGLENLPKGDGISYFVSSPAEILELSKDIGSIVQILDLGNMRTQYETADEFYSALRDLEISKITEFQWRFDPELSLHDLVFCAEFLDIHGPKEAKISLEYPLMNATKFAESVSVALNRLGNLNQR